MIKYILRDALSKRYWTGRSTYGSHSLDILDAKQYKTRSLAQSVVTNKDNWAHAWYNKEDGQWHDTQMEIVEVEVTITVRS